MGACGAATLPVTGALPLLSGKPSTHDGRGAGGSGARVLSTGVAQLLSLRLIRDTGAKGGRRRWHF